MTTPAEQASAVSAAGRLLYDLTRPGLLRTHTARRNRAMAIMKYFPADHVVSAKWADAIEEYERQLHVSRQQGDREGG